jgi:hypothetical protein
VDRSSNKLVILNDDGTLYKVITCSLDKPLDVTCLDDTTVAVSTYNGIEIININSTKNERVIETSEPCDGITHHTLNDFTDGGCIKDIICPCLSFVVLITTDGGLVSIYTYPNVVIVDNISFIFVLMLYLKSICCTHPSSDKAK